MTATEARQKALKINNERDTDQYDDVKQVINAQVDDGALSCYYYETLRNNVVVRLRAEGYKISTYDSQKDGVTVTITW